MRSWDATGDSELAALTTDEAWIAAAFAEMKFRGRTTPELANEARAAVARLRDHPTDGPAEPARGSKLAKIAERLAAGRSKPPGDTA